MLSPSVADVESAPTTRPMAAPFLVSLGPSFRSETAPLSAFTRTPRDSSRPCELDPVHASIRRAAVSATATESKSAMTDSGLLLKESPSEHGASFRVLPKTANFRGGAPVSAVDARILLDILAQSKPRLRRLGHPGV